MEMDNFIQKLTAAVADGCTLQDSIEMIADVFDQPASLIDSAYRVLACSVRHPIKDEKINAEFQKGYLENGFVFLRSIDFLNPLIKKPKYKFYDLAEDIAYSKNHYALIFADHIPVAAISIFEDHPIPQKKLDYLPVISNILSMQLQIEGTALMKRIQDFNHLISLMLGDLTYEPEMLKERFRLLGYAILENKYMITATWIPETEHVIKAENTIENAEIINDTNIIKNTYIEQKNLDSMGQYLKKIFPNAIYTLLDQRVGLFMSTQSPLSDEALRECERKLKNIDIRLGISNGFTELSQAKSHLQEAMDALHFGSSIHPDKHIYLYNDYQLDKIAHTLGSHPDADAFIYPPVKALVKYDVLNKGCLVPTLKAYLKNSSRPQAVCEALAIHKNTLYYRLDKIKSILIADLDNAEITTKIIISLKMLDLQNTHHAL